MTMIALALLNAAASVALLLWTRASVRRINADLRTLEYELARRPKSER